MIGLVIPCNLKYAPYVQHYISALKEADTDFELISWDKTGMAEAVDYRFRFKAKDSNRVLVLIGHFLFSLFAKKIIRKRKYDRLIVFTIAPAFFMSSFLRFKYAKQYILDIRDASPLVKAFPKKFEQIGDAAHSLVVSSPSYKSWIKKGVLLCHNGDCNILKMHRNDAVIRPEKQPYKIAFAGMMNEADINMWLIGQTRDANAFLHSYFGPDDNGKLQIKAFAEKNGIQNVRFFGTYTKEDIVGIYQQHAHFVNIVRKNCAVNRNALPNKLYDAVAAGKPIIVFEHNEAIVCNAKEYGLGIILSSEDMSDLKSALLKKINEFSYDNYQAARKAFIDKVLGDQEAFRNMLRHFAADIGSTLIKKQGGRQ